MMCRSADVPALGATYSSARGRADPPPLWIRARLTGCASPPHRAWRGLSHFALEAVPGRLEWCDHDYPRWGGRNTTPRCVAKLPVLGAPASIRVGAPTLPGSGLYMNHRVHG
jgi:hypothetical protein